MESTNSFSIQAEVDVFLGNLLVIKDQNLDSYLLKTAIHS